MKIYTPAYYQKFHCIASACPDSCCKEWDVDVDTEAAERYRALPGALGDRLREFLRDTEDGTVMTIVDGRCPMWRQDGLCRIQAELGHDALCAVCRQFPRLIHDYGDLLERDLELSCPEAARLILTEDDSLKAEEVPGGEAECDPEVMEILLRSREAVLSFLRKGTYSLPQTLTVLLLYAHAVQDELDGGDAAVLRPEALLAQAREFDCAGSMEPLFAFFRDLEILTPQWAQMLDAGPMPHRWDDRLYAFARYMVRRYWLQAVSDFDIVCRVKFLIAACLLLSALDGDLEVTVQRFSKEIENDPDNVEAILDGAYTSPALTDMNLLGLLQKN